jgi:hypothetical protein
MESLAQMLVLQYTYTREIHAVICTFSTRNARSKIHGQLMMQVTTKFYHILLEGVPDRPNISRRMTANEPSNSYKIRCNGYAVSFGNCRGASHNYKGCHLPLNHTEIDESQISRRPKNKKCWNFKGKRQ